MTEAAVSLRIESDMLIQDLCQHGPSFPKHTPRASCSSGWLQAPSAASASSGLRLQVCTTCRFLQHWAPRMFRRNPPN